MKTSSDMVLTVHDIMTALTVVMSTVLHQSITGHLVKLCWWPVWETRRLLLTKLAPASEPVLG